MFLSVSVFVLAVMVCSGSAAPALLQNSKKTRVAAATNRQSHNNNNNRMKRSPESDGAVAENYLLSGAVKVAISRNSITYKRPGGYNEAIADFEFLEPKHIKTTKWKDLGLTHTLGQVGDRVLVMTVDKAKTSVILALTRIDPVTGAIYSLKFVYSRSKDLGTF